MLSYLLQQSALVAHQLRQAIPRSWVGATLFGQLARIALARRTMLDDVNTGRQPVAKLVVERERLVERRASAVDHACPMCIFGVWRDGGQVGLHHPPEDVFGHRAVSGPARMLLLDVTLLESAAGKDSSAGGTGNLL